MENLICPNCRKDFGIKADMHGTDVKACISCDSAFVVMYVAGFNDGLRAKAPALSGEVVKMGDLSLDGDKWTGLVISCPKDALRDVAVNLLGKTVVISAPGVSAPAPAGEVELRTVEVLRVYNLLVERYGWPKEGADDFCKRLSASASPPSYLKSHVKDICGRDRCLIDEGCDDCK